MSSIIIELIIQNLQQFSAISELKSIAGFAGGVAIGLVLVVNYIIIFRLR